jgi:hypothetical protein
MALESRRRKFAAAEIRGSWPGWIMTRREKRHSLAQATTDMLAGWFVPAEAGRRR